MGKELGNLYPLHSNPLDRVGQVGQLIGQVFGQLLLTFTLRAVKMLVRKGKEKQWL